jgi:hypothetical protein
LFEEDKIVESKEEHRKAHSGKGFGGLLSTVSDVDAAITTAVQQKSNQSPGGAAMDSAHLPPEGPSKREAESSGLPYQVTGQQPSGTSSGGKWLLGIGVVIGVVWLISSMNNAPSPGRSQPTPNITNPYDQIDKRTGRPTEEVPPVGTKLVLGPAQIRYCLSEGIRLDAARTALNAYLELDVDRFNAMIANYNSRCSDFRYRSGSLESARAEVERNRLTLEAEGRARFSR